MKTFQAFITSLILLLTNCRIQAQQTFKPDQVLPADSAIIIGKLDNGLTYYIRENKKPEKRAELRLIVKAGSILEDENQRITLRYASTNS